MAVLVWAGAIFTLSAQPDLRSGLPDLWDLVLRKAAHLTEYAVLGWLLLRALAPNGTTNRQRGLAVLLSVLYAASDEVHQSFVPGRTAAALDVLIDAVGGLLGVSVDRFRARRSVQRALVERSDPSGSPDEPT